MSDVSADTGPAPVFSGGKLQGNLTSNQGQPPADSGAAALQPASPLAPQGPMPQPTPPPNLPDVNYPPMPQQPQQQKLGPAPDAKDYHRHSMAFASAMAVLGAVSSAFTRQSGNAALSAFAGALNGWQQGNLQAYEEAAKKWEQDTKATLDNNRQIMDQYRMALENRKMNIDEQMSQIQLIATRYHDQMMYDAAASKNYTMVAQIYEKNHEFTVKAQEAADKLQAGREKTAEEAKKSASYWMNHPDEFLKLPPAQQAAVKQFAELHNIKGGGLAGQLVAKENSEREARGEQPMTAQEEMDFVQRVHPPRSAPAMAIDAFKRDFRQKQGRDPNGQEIADFASHYTGETSYGRTVGTIGGRAEFAGDEVASLIPQAVEASRALPRGKFVPLNKLLQMGEEATSNPQYNDFLMANVSLAKAYGRAMNPQGMPRVSEQKEVRAMGILSMATDEKAYETQIRRLWKEVQATKGAAVRSAQGRTGGDINAPVPGLDDQTVGAPTRVQSPADAQKLAPGTHYVTPDGQEFVR